MGDGQLTDHRNWLIDSYLFIFISGFFVFAVQGWLKFVMWYLSDDNHLKKKEIVIEISLKPTAKFHLNYLRETSDVLELIEIRLNIFHKFEIAMRGEKTWICEFAIKLFWVISNDVVMWLAIKFFKAKSNYSKIISNTFSNIEVLKKLNQQHFLPQANFNFWLISESSKIIQLKT